MYARAEPPQIGLVGRSVWTEQDEVVFRFWGQLDGPALSSTRVEGWAIIGAHLIAQPIQLGIDNKADLDVFQSILRGRANSNRKPWAMRPDGDVWQAFEGMVEQRGRHASCGTKVKGHATDEEVRRGNVSAADKRGNDAADKMVLRGGMTYGECR